MTSIRYIIVALIGAFPIVAENAGRVSGPSLGYVKRSDGVRPIVGVPGAAYFAPPLNFEGFEVAAISSERHYAVLLASDRIAARVVALDSGEVLAALFADRGSAFSGAYVSADGRSIALARDNEVDIVSGLPANPTLKKTVPAPAGVVRVSVSDDGEAIAVSDGNSIYISDATGQRQIASVRAIYELRFRQGGRELIYADGETVTIASPEGTRVIAGPADDVSSVRAALLSHDGLMVLAADVGSQTLLIGQSSGGITERVKLPCAPGELTSINDSTFRLRCESGNQVHLIQLDPHGTRVLFVPEPVE